MIALRRLLYNPLFVSDGLARVRTWRAPFLIGLYLTVLGLVAFVQFATQQNMARYNGAGQIDVGSSVFTSVALVQLALVCVLAPGLASGAISGERERQTFDVLAASRMKPWHIVWGKLVTSIAFIVLLIVAALPVLGTVFLFGGIDFQQFLVSQLLTVTTALALAAVSLFISALVRRSLPSTVVAYALAMVGLVGSAVLGGLLTTMYLQVQMAVGGPGAGPIQPFAHPLLFVNPFTAMTALLQPSPVVGPVYLGRVVQIMMLGSGPASTSGPLVEAWQASILIELLLVVLSVFGAIQALRGPRALPWLTRSHAATPSQDGPTADPS